MTLNDRIASFEILGEILRIFPNPQPGHEDRMAILVSAALQAEKVNPWFTQDQIKRALNAIGTSLHREKLEDWLRPYRDRLLSAGNPGRVGVIMAGNIPAVGFHDLLCVLISGNVMIGKLSSLDGSLLIAIVEILCSLNSGWEGVVNWKEGPIGHIDYLIATGSNNSSRYFDYYFGKYKHIIRRTRNTIAVITGNETHEELIGLVDDTLSFFGLGCRNVSKIFIPENYDLSTLIPAMSTYDHITKHLKYRNNYDFRKAMFLLAQKPFFDAGNLLLTTSGSIASPVSVLYYESYGSLQEVEQFCRLEGESIQCVVSSEVLSIPSIYPGLAQMPDLWDYADGVDTMEFLLADFLPRNVWNSNKIH